MKSFSGAKEFGKSFLLVGVVQGLVQVVGFVSGILIINWLSIEEYAYYTLANTLLSTMTVLADGGISRGVTAYGGQVWEDDQKLSGVVATGVHLRKVFARLVLLVMLPILLGLLMYNGASVWQAFLICLSIIPVFLTTLTTTIIQIPERLKQNIKFLQRVDIENKVLRLVTILLTLPIFSYAFVAVGANAGAQLWLNKRLMERTGKYIDLSQPVDEDIKEKILTIVKKILPTSLYFAVSSQLSVFLISIFGKTESVAHIGALGRFAAVLAVLTMLVDVVIVPRFARLNKEPGQMITFFIISQVGLVAVSVVVVVLTYYLADYALIFLGDGYQGLSYELVLIVASSCLGLLSRSTNNMLSSRGIIVPPLFFIGYAIAVQIFAIWFFPIDTLVGVIKYGLTNILALYLLRVVYFFLNLKTINDD